MTTPDRDELVERAAAISGSTDVGPSGWEEGLDRLLAAVDQARLQPRSQSTVEAMLTGRLARRQTIESWYREHGDEVRPVEEITVVIGLPRTATTAMQHVLALDPAFRFQRRWEISSPVPPPEIGAEAEDPRRLAAREAAGAATEPSVQHISSVDGPVDDGMLLGLDFGNQELGLPVEPYTRWWRRADASSTYAYHRRVLGLLHHHRPPRRWLVKAPYHNFHLDELAEAYPNARFVMTHRDPALSFPSTCSTVLSARRDLLPDEETDPIRLAAFLLEHLTEGIGRAMAARRRIGDERFLDVSQHEVEHDPLGTVARIYLFLGAEPSPGTEERIQAWAAENRRGARGTHRYAAEEHGLTSDAIREAFADYIQTFAVPLESPR